MIQDGAGTLSLTKTGTGDPILTGANTYSGTTTISAGILQVGNGTTLGTLGTGAVVNNASLRINRSDAITVANDISGTGGLTKLGAGTLSLTGNNTYGGTTTISAGSLQVGNGGTSGTLGSGAVVDNANLAFNRSNAITIANNISGSGSLTQAGAGTTTLTGTNSYSGTTISAGTLQVGNGGTTGNLGTGAVVDNASLVFNRNDAISIANNISGTGSLTQSGAGTATLSGTNSYSGTTTISTGTLKAGSTSAFGTNSAVTVANGATLDLAGKSNSIGSLAGAGTVTDSVVTAATLTTGGDTTSTTFSGVIQNGTGTLSLTKTGAGTTTLTGTNTYSGTTTISAGTLQVGSGSTTGNLGTGAVVDNASLVFNRNDAISVANNISGTGSFSQSGAGTATLSGTNSYSGTTTISTGTLKAGSTSAFGTNSAVTVANGATLDLAGNSNSIGSLAGAGTVTDSTATAATLTTGGDTTSTTFSGVLQNGTGTLSLTKTGAGTTTLTGANTYSGTTTISAGTLQVGNGGTTGNLGTGAVVDNANLTFARSVDTTIANDISGTGNVSANITSSAGNLTVNSTSFSLTGGTIDLRADGNVTLSKPIATTNTTSNAVKLVAGQAVAAGVSTDGNVIVNGTGNITVGTGGVAAIYSGSVAGTTGISGMAASGSGKFRYNSDETTTNFSQALGVKSVSNNGVNVIYREAPTLTFKVNDASKTYDGSTFSGGNFNATPTAGTLQNGDSVALITGNATFAGTAQGKKNVADTGTSISASDTGGTNALGYAVSYTSGTLTVNKKDVSLSAITAANKTYDASSSATITSGAIATGVGSETLLVSGSGTFNNANAADGKTVTVADVTALTKTNGTGSWSNYTLTTTGALTTNANITKKDVSLASITAASKTYDGSNTASITSSAITTGVAGETLLVSGSGTFNNANAADGKAVTVANVTALTKSNGTGAWSNYTLTTTGALTTTANITKKDVSLASIAAANKTYDGSNTATITSGAITTGVGTETLLVSGSGTFNNANAADGKNVTVADVTALTKTNGTGSWSNYNLTTTGALNTTANIVKASLNVSATAVTKTYDGSTSATGTATVGALASANDSFGSAGTQTFLDKNVGTNKTVTVSGVTIKDASNADMTGNYAITYVNNTTSVITKAPLVVTAISDARFVTQADASAYKGVSYSGYVGGETSAVLGGALSISRTNALTNVAAGTYSGVLVPAGLTASNYDIRYTAGNYTIVPADRLLVDTTNQTVTYGTTPTYTTTARYLDSRDNLIKVLTQTGTNNNNYTFNDGAGTTISLALKPYTGTQVAAQSTSGSTVIGTYEVKDLAYAQTGTNFNGTPIFIGTVTIDAKAITPSASGVSKVYDGTTSMNNVVIGMNGKAGTDLVSISGTGAFSQKNVGTNLGYTVTGISLSGADASNYYLSGGMNHLSGTNGAITPASLVLSTDNITKGYDGTVKATGVLKISQGTRLFGADSVSGGVFEFSNPTAGLNNKVVRVSGALISDGNEGRNYLLTYLDNTESTISSPIPSFVLPALTISNTGPVDWRSDANTKLSESATSRDLTKPSLENLESCKSAVSTACVCTSSGNDGVSCSSSPKSVEIKSSETPQS